MEPLTKLGLPPKSAGPELVSPLAVYLASAECTVSGEAFSAGYGRYARVFIGVTNGWLSPGGETATAEDIGAHLDELGNLGDFEVPGSQGEELHVIGLAYARRHDLQGFADA
jgi:hypothetical protein